MAETRTYEPPPPTLERRQTARPHESGVLRPLLRLLLYYAAIVAIGVAIVNLVPGGHRIIAAPLAVPAADQAAGLITGAADAAAAPPAPDPWGGIGGRMLMALTTVLGALALALPVAWVHMLTRRLRYSPSLVHTMVILPIVVSGVVLVVKSSLALAFALAGIVAGVRFRQKLNEPKEAVYVLLSLGVGLAAGVQALDIAFAVSLAFNAVVLVIWRYDVGSLETPGAVPPLAIGETDLLPEGEARRQVHRDAIAVARDMDTDGLLLVYAKDADAARHGVEVALLGRAEEWRITRPMPADAEHSRFEVVLRLDRKTDPMDLLGELEERWSAQVDAAEYIPFRRRFTKDEEPDDDDDDDD
jgi:hypothetical protein